MSRFAIVAATASLGGLLFGYDTGVISGALLFIRKSFALDAAGQGAVVSLALAGAAVGGAAAGWLSDRHGRRRVIIGTACTFVLGALLCAVAMSVPALLAGRFVVGLAIGVASLLTPLYLGEMAPAARRGAVVSLNQMCITLGIVLSYAVDYALTDVAGGWRWMLGLGVVPAIVLGVGMLMLPDSPRWLAGAGRMGEAERALRRIRGPEDDVAAELASLRTDAQGGGGRVAPWSEVLSRRMRRVLVIGVGLAVFQQVTGINTVLYFAPTIFNQAGLGRASTAILATAGVGVVNVVMTFVALRLLDTLGRRTLLLAGLGGMFAALVLIAAVFAIGLAGGLATVTVGAVAVYVAFFAIGLGPVFWLLIAEIFPLRVRGRAMGLATVANWGANLVVSQTFVGLLHGIGAPATFGLYAVLTACAIAFTLLLVPETRGRTLEQIEAELSR
jgi:MFS transporter, SP family, galactose:H+ symporter